VKIVFDKVDTLEPWGYLMGDNMPKKFIWRHIKKNQINDQESKTETNEANSFDTTPQSNKNTID
jgi:hypothetical protein